MKHLAIFASGAGSNAAKIIEHFRNHPSVQVTLIVCNNPAAGVVKIAESNGIPVLIIEREKFLRGDAYLPELEKYQIHLIVLAGFLWKVPELLIKSFEKRIINIHPALLPKYGGKGMYGLNVHQAVIEHKEKESGITIHYVDEKYDNGDIIFQASCPVMETDTSVSLAERIHELEHKQYALIIEKLAEKF